MQGNFLLPPSALIVRGRTFPYQSAGAPHHVAPCNHALSSKYMRRSLTTFAGKLRGGARMRFQHFTAQVLSALSRHLDSSLSDRDVLQGEEQWAAYQSSPLARTLCTEMPIVLLVTSYGLALLDGLGHLHPRGRHPRRLVTFERAKLYLVQPIYLPACSELVHKCFPGT